MSRPKGSAVCAGQHLSNSARTCNLTSFAGNRLGGVLLIAKLKLPLRMQISHGSAGAVVGSIGKPPAGHANPEPTTQSCPLLIVAFSAMPSMLICTAQTHRQCTVFPVVGACVCSTGPQTSTTDCIAICHSSWKNKKSGQVCCMGCCFAQSAD